MTVVLKVIGLISDFFFFLRGLCFLPFWWRGILVQWAVVLVMCQEWLSLWRWWVLRLLGLLIVFFRFVGDGKFLFNADWTWWSVWNALVCHDSGFQRQLGLLVGLFKFSSSWWCRTLVRSMEISTSFFRGF